MNGHPGISTKPTDLVVRAKHLTVTFIVVLFITLSPSVFAGILQGVVVSAKGDPRPHIRINFSGPAQRVVITDAKGQYRVSAPGGTYRTRISDKLRRQDQTVSIPDSGVKNLTLKLNW